MKQKSKMWRGRTELALCNYKIIFCCSENFKMSVLSIQSIECIKSNLWLHSVGTWIIPSYWNSNIYNDYWTGTGLSTESFSSSELSSKLIHTYIHTYIHLRFKIFITRVWTVSLFSVEASASFLLFHQPLHMSQVTFIFIFILSCKSKYIDIEHVHPYYYWNTLMKMVNLLEI
jgi:hypothetical protein